MESTKLREPETDSSLPPLPPPPLPRPLSPVHPLDPDFYDSKEKILINVGGIRHETLLSTLLAKPFTRLGMLAREHLRRKKNKLTRYGREEYFFDRHPGVFATIIDYYRTGELHVPVDMCGAVARREFIYWRIDDSQIKACCWTNYSSYLDNLKSLNEFRDSRETEIQHKEMLPALEGWKRRQMKLWIILDHPRSSRKAMAFALTSFAFVMASIAGFCIETDATMYTERNISRECWWGVREKLALIYVSRPALQYLDYLCTAFFTVEFILRVCVAPDKRQFFRTVMNIIDILALLPLYFQVTLNIVDNQNCVKNSKAFIELIFILRIVRIFRIFHLVRHYRALQILVQAIAASIQELLMLFIFLLIATLIFATLIFYAERKGTFTAADGQFENIPTGFWWSIITMTTVGYGDISPKTTMGRVIGAVCAVCGVLLVALTIPVISNNFALFYAHVRTRDDIEKKTKQATETDFEKYTPVEVREEDVGYVVYSNGRPPTQRLVCPLADHESATETMNDDNYNDYEVEDDDDDDYDGKCLTATASPKSLSVHLVQDNDFAPIDSV